MDVTRTRGSVTRDRDRLGPIVATLVSVALAVLLVPTVGASAAVASQLRRYPYLTDLVATNVTINWATTTAVTTGSLTYGRVGIEDCTANTVAATQTSVTVGSTAEYQWKALVSGLVPDASYCYRVFGGTVDLLGTDASPVFRAQVPADATTPFSFAVFGDWGVTASDGTNVDQARLFAQLAASGARFAVTTGDNGNGSGSQTEYGDLVQTGSGVSALFGPQFWPVAGRSVPLFASQGNHGMSNVPLTNWPQDRAVAASGGRYQMDTYCCANGTSSKSYPSTWYAFDAGGARFYVLSATWSNSNVGSTDLYDNDYDAHWSPTSPEYTWLAADLASHSNQLKFAFFHFPMYSANSTEASDPWLQGPNRLEGLLAANGVDIVFNGHAHIYTRSAPSAAGMPVTYVTGGGGATLEPVSRCGAPVVAAIGWSYSSSTHGSSCGGLARPTSIDQVFHFLLVTVSGSQVTVTPTDELGRTFDVQTYAFGGGGGSGDTEPPAAPTNLTATASTGRVDLAWTAASDNVGVTGYRVVRDGTTIATIGATTSYADTTVAAARTYSYTVRALDAAANVSDPSAPAVVTTPSPPPSGGQLTFIPTDDAYIQASSPSANAGSATTVQTDGSPIKDFLMRFTVSGVGANTVTSAQLRLWVVDPSTSGGTIRPTTSTAWNEGSVTWSNAPAAAASPSATIGAITTGSWITVDVTAFVTGDGVVSLRVSSTSTNGADYASSEGAATTAPQLVVTTGGGGGSGDTEPPAAPTNLTATASTGRVDLAWTAASDNVGVTGYRVVRDGTTIATIGATTSYADTTVAAARTYSYTVRALDAAANVSDPSAPAVVTTPSPPPSGGQLTFIPTDDAYIQASSPSANAGSATTVQTDGSPIKDFLMRFTVSGVGANTVTSAQLRLWVVDPSTSGGTIRPTTSTAWNEGSVTWSNAPAAAASPSATIGAITTGSWITVDVTAFVTGDGVVSLRVSSTSTNGADYASSEGAATTAPQLVVTTG